MSLELSARTTLIDRVITRSVATDFALVLSGAVLTALAAQIAIPMWPVPITGQTFGLYQVPVEWDAWVNSILTVLSVMGIINNPLTTGLND
jgi:biotin transport system substrate-specific component